MELKDDVVCDLILENGLRVQAISDGKDLSSLGEVNRLVFRIDRKIIGDRGVLKQDVVMSENIIAINPKGKIFKKQYLKNPIINKT